MSIYVAGSMAFDRIMTFKGRFANYILPDKLDILNISFLVDSLVEKRGGCAGNIAYTLSLMGEKPLILSTVGKNFGDYATFLKGIGLSLEGIRIIPEEFTGGCTLFTDEANNQISGFYPAAMNYPCLYTFPHADAKTDWGIVSPGNLEDMRTLPRLFKEKGIPYIYDPGQQIPAIQVEDLLAAINGAALLVTNDYELELVCTKTGRTLAELMAMCGGIITTLGERGSVVRAAGKEECLGTVKPTTVADPTGAGDSYRSGLLKGLVHGVDVFAAAKLGATCSSYCIEQHGTQEHHFTYADFAARHLATFGTEPAIRW